MKLHSKDGIERMEVKSIGHDGDRIVLKGKMMGAMATTIYPAITVTANKGRFSTTVQCCKTNAKQGWHESLRTGFIGS